MKLETHAGVYADPATIEDIERAVMGLVTSDAFIVLVAGHDDDETYVQAAGNISENFIVERREGRAGDHYRGDRRITANELITLFAGYLSWRSDWRASIEWHRVRVDGTHLNNGPSA